MCTSYQRMQDGIGAWTIVQNLHVHFLPATPCPACAAWGLLVAWKGVCLAFERSHKLANCRAPWSLFVEHMFQYTVLCFSCSLTLHYGDSFYLPDPIHIAEREVK